VFVHQLAHFIPEIIQQTWVLHKMSGELIFVRIHPHCTRSSDRIFNISRKSDSTNHLHGAESFLRRL